jgi:hypothetical protein
MKKETNAIESTVKTAQGATVKITSTKPSLTAVETLNLISASAIACASGETALSGLENALKDFNKNALNLHNGGVRLLDGRKKDAGTMANRKAFIDQCEASGLTPKTAQNYYEMFFKTVNSGKELKAFNYKSNAKKNGDKTEANICDVLAKVYNHSEFEDFSEEFQKEVTDILLTAKYI